MASYSGFTALGLVPGLKGQSAVRRYSDQTGVTLVELVITIAVLAILVAIASPSLSDFAERQAIKGAAETIVSVVAQAKEEAIKRDKPVRVDFAKMGAGICVGAIEGTAPCDCSAGTCPIVTSAESSRDLKRVSLGADPKFGADAGFVIDPKTGTLLDPGDSGSLDLTTQLGYTVRISVNVVARPSVCVPAGDKTIPGVKPCA